MTKLPSTINSDVIENYTHTIVKASIQIVIPTEKELLYILTEKIDRIEKSLTDRKNDFLKIHNILNDIKKNIHNETSLRYLSVKELAIRYSLSESQQKQLRGRIKNQLPFYQDGIGGKIKYKVSEIDEWMSSQKVKRGI